MTAARPSGRATTTAAPGATPAAPSPYLFVVGCPRSGTTMLKRMLDAHKDVAMTPCESHWVDDWFHERRGLTSRGTITPELVSSLLAYPRFRELGLDPEDLARLATPGRALGYGEFVSAVFAQHGQLRGKALVGDKTPGYVREIPTLHAICPRTRFVHLVRDGRDVCLSVVAWRKRRRPGLVVERLAERFTEPGMHPVTTAALWWEWTVRLGREDGASLPPGLYHEARYEQLVSSPAAACRRLCDFLGIGYDGAMTRYHEGRTTRRSGLDAKHAWLPPTPGLRDWRAQMRPPDLARFEAVAGGLLEELGYPRGLPAPRGAAADAARARATFAGRALESGRRLPVGWDA